ncbi:MAG: hypothetical protein RJA81_2249 [Planctomycetota bacterium]|jgi:hypothetical protein
MPRRRINRQSVFLFLAVWLSSGWFHQSRDWNSASRLMLVYALGDRASISIDGLQRQTGDLAFKDGHYFCDKAPGYSFLAVPAYVSGKSLFGWPDHPLNQDGFAYWTADFWVTWLTSGLATGIIAVILFQILTSLNITTRWASVSSLMCCFASPMMVYASLAYGHQVASALFLGSAWIALAKEKWIRSPKRLVLIGICCGFGVLTELAQAPLAILIGLVVLCSDRNPQKILNHAGYLIIGAVPSALILFAYNFIAFGSPLDMGYFHHATQQFAKVHSADNPLGLTAPDFSHLMPLIWGEYRGLLFYAPWAILAPVGWLKMVLGRNYGVLSLSLGGFLIPLWVNLSYPEWTGGWSTGPRLLVPALPWLALASGYSMSQKFCRFISVPLFLWGWVITILFVSVGGRISQDIQRPLRDAVLPLWSGGRMPPFWPGERFARQTLTEFFGLSLGSPQAMAALLSIIQAIFVVGCYSLRPPSSDQNQIKSNESDSTSTTETD